MFGFSMQRQQPFTLPLLMLQIFGASQRTHMSILYSIQSLHTKPHKLLPADEAYDMYASFH
jgi:hypothetical protein